MATPKSPTIEKVFYDFESKLKADEKFDDEAVARLMTLLHDDQTVTAPKIREALFTVATEDGNGE